MPRCSQCSRLNPEASSYCFFDGRSLGEPRRRPRSGVSPRRSRSPRGGRVGRSTNSPAPASRTGRRRSGCSATGTLAAFFAPHRPARPGGAGATGRPRSRRRRRPGRGASRLADGRASIPPGCASTGRNSMSAGSRVGQHGEWSVTLKNDGMGLLRGTIRATCPGSPSATGRAARRGTSNASTRRRFPSASSAAPCGPRPSASSAG